ncbi:nuclear envelope pore membrane protein POM 121C-like isoform X3 [Trichosurus vulpecula]|uniref:nuclear envelope pore membrane protein POM 121C-like isoform X3 n=1 Tax=Trichosurus vulpecula TaxID=9337 RepID=UPI00186B3D5E|nr:nuclear envelope pore membrane protein POM 121C-like isoform X3 [Trichosurus vulpecula]
MGGYLGKPGPPEPPRRERPPQAPSPQLLSPVRRLHLRDHPTTPYRFSLAPRRRYPVQQAQYSALGTLPTVCWEGYQRKNVLSARNSHMVSSPVTVRIARPDLSRSPLEQVVNSAMPSPSSNVPDPCAKETVMNALKESRKRAVEEEDQIFCDAQENKRRRHDSSGSGHSAFEPLVANGAPASLVPKPGSLKRSLTSQCTEDNLNKRSRTSSTSSLTNTSPGGIPSSIRNAITSSYSSTRGFSQLWKRSGPSTSPLSSPASSRSQTPERPMKKAREEEFHQSSCLTPMTSDKESQAEKVTDTPTWKKQSSWSTPTTSGSAGKRKRKVQLLASRRGDQLTLPPPPQLGYSITAEDLDLEKKAALQWFNKVLEEKTETSPAPRPLSFALPSPETTSSPAAPPASSANPLLDSLKKMQNSPSPPALTADPVAAASAVAPSPLKPASPPAATGPAEPGPPAASSSSSKPIPTFSLLTSSAALTVTTASQASPAPVSDSSTKPLPTTSPKPSILFGMLSTPPLTSMAPTTSTAPAAPAPVVTPAATPVAAPVATSAPPPATPMFKPIFGVPPKMESGASSPAAPSATTPMSCGSVLPTAPSTSTTTFKPIFGSMGPPTSVPLASASPFLKQPSSVAPTTAVTSSVLAPLFSGLPSVQPTAAPATATTATSSRTTDSGSKPTFGFGLSSLASTTASAPAATTSTTTTTPSPAQPFLFGAAPASGASFTPSTGSMFQFNKPAATVTTTTTVATPATTFGATQTAPSSTAGFGFGGTVTTAAPPTTSQATLTFGPTTTTTAAFSTPFGSSVKTMPPPAYPGAAPQPTFGTADGQQQQQGASKAGPLTSFSSTFTFGGSAASSPALPQPTFGSATQPAFGGAKPPTSFGTPASTQPAFGSTNTVFSFGTTTSSSFGATTQTTSSGTSGSMFSSMTLAPFTFGSSTPAASSGGFGASTAVPGTSSSTAAFSFGASQSGATSATAPFGGTLNQNPLGAPSQSTPFAFSVANTTENKPVFGGASSVGSSLSFGTPTTPAQGFVGAGPSFGPSTPSFSIGAGSKTPGARQRLQARRQHTRKK